MKTTEMAPNGGAQGELFAEAAAPLRFPCTYGGHHYAPPCRAKRGEPCNWGDNPWHRGEFHAERRFAAGETLKTMDGEPAGDHPNTIEDEAPEDDEGDE